MTSRFKLTGSEKGARSPAQALATMPHPESPPHVLCPQEAGERESTATDALSSERFPLPARGAQGPAVFADG